LRHSFSVGARHLKKIWRLIFYQYLVPPGPSENESRKL
jgi:hypothetical protein